MIEPIESLDDIQRAKRRKAYSEAYEAYVSSVPIGVPFSGSLIPLCVAVILIQFANSTISNTKREIKETTKRAAEDERRLHEQILKNQLPPNNFLRANNFLRQEVVKIG